MNRNETQKERVFVYGTLMKGFRNNDSYLGGKALFCGRGSLKGDLYHLPENYPALIHGASIVHGEVYELYNSESRAGLDLLVGYREERDDNLYDRVRLMVELEDGQNLECWVYVYNDTEYARTEGIHIPDGDWRAFAEKEVKG